MATGYTVQISELRNAANFLTEKNGEFQQQVGRLLGCKDELQGSWEGEANMAFNAAFNKDYESLNSFYQVISEYVRVLHEIAAEYARIEMENEEIARTRNI